MRRSARGSRSTLSRLLPAAAAVAACVLGLSGTPAVAASAGGAPAGAAPGSAASGSAASGAAPGAASGAAASEAASRGGPVAKDRGATAARSGPYHRPAYDADRADAALPGEAAADEPPPEDYSKLAPGLGRLLEDLRDGSLQPEAFVNHAYAKLGFQGGVPRRYRDDDPLPTPQRSLLGLAIGREMEKLGHPVRQSIANRAAHAEQLGEEAAPEPLTAPAPTATPLSAPAECGPDDGFNDRVIGDYACHHTVNGFKIFYNVAGDHDVDPYDGAGDEARGGVADNGVPNYIDEVTDSLLFADFTYLGLGYQQQHEDENILVFIGSPRVPNGVGMTLPPTAYGGHNVIMIGSNYGVEQPGAHYLVRHELFHTMQYGLIPLRGLVNLDTTEAWMEATAEWGAHQALNGDPEVPSSEATAYAGRLPAFFSRPDEALLTWDGFNGDRQYGAFIFAEFMAERFGTGSIRQTWQRFHDQTVPSAASAIAHTVQGYGDLADEMRAFGVANYQLCDGTGSTDYGGSWHYTDADVGAWCTILSGDNVGTGAEFPTTPRPKHETITLDADGKAHGTAIAQPGGARYVDLVDAGDPSVVWNMAVKLTRSTQSPLPLLGDMTVTVVDWETLPGRCGTPDGIGHPLPDATVDTRIGGSACNVVTLMFTNDDPTLGSSGTDWETTYTSQAGGGIGGLGSDVRIGVQPGGNLIVPGSDPSAGTRTTDLGLRYKPTNYEGVSDVACFCEGWGISVTPPGGVGQYQAWSHGVDGLSENAEVKQFTTTPTTATSVVEVFGTDYPLYVTHEFTPSSRPELYDVHVTITSLAPPGEQPAVTYRRVVDWDVEPTPVKEYGTIKADDPHVQWDSDDGLAGPNPESGRPVLHHEGSFTDAGPYDQGAVFDFNVPLETKDKDDPSAGTVGDFRLFYGAAADKAGAVDALNAVGAPVYSLAYPSTAGNPQSGEPTTFILGYKPGR